MDTLELHVHSAAFDEECAACSKEIAKGFLLLTTAMQTTPTTRTIDGTFVRLLRATDETHILYTVSVPSRSPMAM